MAHYKHTVKDWSMAQNVWAEHNRYVHSLGRHGVPLGYATTLIDTGERFMGRFTDYPVLAVRQHATDVITFSEPGRFILRTGGWITVTTLERLQEFTPNSLHIVGQNVQSKKRKGTFDIYLHEDSAYAGTLTEDGNELEVLL